MKTWIKILVILPVLAIEGIVIFLAIPELSLITGALLLITVLIGYTLIQDLWTSDNEAWRSGKGGKSGNYGDAVPNTDPVRSPDSLKKKRGFPFFRSQTKPAGESPLQAPEQKRRFPFLRSQTKPAGEDVPARGQGRESRFPTFVAMFEGVRRLGQGLRASTRKNPDTLAGGAPGQGLPDRSGISLASVRADPAAPVPVKQEPSPFSPLIGDSNLDTDLIHHRKETGGPGALGEAGFEEDFADIGIELPDAGDERGEAAEDEPSLVLDNDGDTRARASHKSIPGHTSPQGMEGEISLDKELNSLDHLDLDGVGLENGAAAPDTGKGEDKEQILAKKMIESDVRAEYIGEFSPEQGKDTDLLSSLSTDMQGSKKRVNRSLVRDMKDVRIQVNEIEEELLSFLQAK